MNKTPDIARVGSTGGSAVWFKTPELKATASDGDCEGMIWTWQEYFTTNPETEEVVSAGWHVKRRGWRECSAGWYNERTSPPMWTHSNLTQMPPPNTAGHTPKERNSGGCV